MAGYSGMSMSNNAVQAYGEGKKPFSRITKEDIEKHGINVSITLFRWFVQNYCRSCEWHHSSPKIISLIFTILKVAVLYLRSRTLNSSKLSTEIARNLSRK